MTEPKRKTNLHANRWPDEKWQRLTEAAKAEGVTVTELLHGFADWWLREPGAKLPKRPDAG